MKQKGTISWTATLSGTRRQSSNKKKGIDFAARYMESLLELGLIESTVMDIERIISMLQSARGEEPRRKRAWTPL